MPLLFTGADMKTTILSIQLLVCLVASSATSPSLAQPAKVCVHESRERCNQTCGKTDENSVDLFDREKKEEDVLERKRLLELCKTSVQNSKEIKALKTKLLKQMDEKAVNNLVENEVERNYSFISTGVFGCDFSNSASPLTISSFDKYDNHIDRLTLMMMGNGIREVMVRVKKTYRDYKASIDDTLIEFENDQRNSKRSSNDEDVQKRKRLVQISMHKDLQHYRKKLVELVGKESVDALDSQLKYAVIQQ